jgi:hypothetical protein
MPLRALHWTVITAACVLALAGCKKKPTEADTTATGTPPAATSPAAPTTTDTTTAPTTATTTATTTAPEPAEQTTEQRQAAEKKAKLEYATMEDGFLNDPRAQWATSARASSSFNEKQPPEDVKESRAWRATGRTDGRTWSQSEQDIGMDWLEVGFDKPVQATAVRAVFTGGDAVQAITKVELIDESGAAQVVWSGLSEDKQDKRGERTWLVKTFPKTAGKVKAVKLTFANNVSSGYKEVDAVQLVGE